MRLVLGEDERVAAWMAPQLGVDRFAAPFVTIGFASGEHLVGGALFNNYNGANIDLTIAGRGTVNRGAWRAIRSYAFDQLGCRRITVAVKRGNGRVRQMAERFGFTREADLPGWFKDDDGVVFRMLREDCKW